MPEAGLEQVRRGLELFQAGDLDSWEATLDPEIEWDISAHPLPDWPDRGRGRGEFMRNMVAYTESWLDYEMAPVEITDAGEHVLLTIEERARMRGTQVALERELHILWTVTGGLVTRFRVFKTREDAVAAVA